MSLKMWSSGELVLPPPPSFKSVHFAPGVNSGEQDPPPIPTEVTIRERVIFFGLFGRELLLVWIIATLHILSGITFNCLPSDPKHLTFDRGCPRDLLVRLLDVLEELHSFMELHSCSRKEPPPGCPLPRTGCPQQAPRRCRSRAQEGQLSASPLPRHRLMGRVAGPASLLGLQLSPSAPRWGAVLTPKAALSRGRRGTRLTQQRDLLWGGWWEDSSSSRWCLASPRWSPSSSGVGTRRSDQDECNLAITPTLSLVKSENEHWQYWMIDTITCSMSICLCINIYFGHFDMCSSWNSGHLEKLTCCIEMLTLRLSCDIHFQFHLSRIFFICPVFDPKYASLVWSFKRLSFLFDIDREFVFCTEASIVVSR